MENKATETAWGPMFQVALEQFFPERQRIIHDAFVYRFMPSSLQRLVNLNRFDFIRRMILNLMERKVPGIRGGILCRKRYIYEKLNDALKNGIQSVVILGAGFDTLAYRVPELASQQVYEVDFPEIMQSKKVLLQRLLGHVPAHVKLVPVDFDSQDLEVVLQQSGYQEIEPAFFIWEGVTQYISETAVRKVFECLRKSAPGSQLVFTYIRKDFIDGEQMHGLKTLYDQTITKNQLWKFGFEPEAIGDFLSQYSWREVEQAGKVEYQKRYLDPANRVLMVMEVERAVYAERIAN